MIAGIQIFLPSAVVESPANVIYCILRNNPATGKE
jgi:hypothetical protein